MHIVPKARLIANYLPQFHPIPENDKWWGKGFTEWTNVTKAKRLFRDHYQPQLPADLGFYDLRVPEVREAQAALAREYGIEAFCYWHYWFAGERLLERPFEEVLASGKPNFPFCLGWANHSWNGLWSGGDEKQTLKAQTYPGKEDHRRHFEYLLTAFRDPRYLRVDGKPLLVIFKPTHIPNSKAAFDYWRQLATHAGLPGLHLVATLDHHDRHWDARAHGFDAVTIWVMPRIFNEARPHLRMARFKKSLRRIRPGRLRRYAERVFPGLNLIFNYAETRSLLICEDKFDVTYHPIALPNWDTTARYGRNAAVLHGSSPEAFRLHLQDVLRQVREQPPEQRIVFLKSWNEWAEGNYLEPDCRYGHGYLKVLKEEITPTAQIPSPAPLIAT